MTTITVKLADDIAERVQQYSKKNQVDVEEVILASLRKFMLLAELNELQTNLTGKATTLGFDREESIFDAIS